MFRPEADSTQEDRCKQCEEAKSCLTLESTRSDNGRLRLCRRRKSFCGLQLDGFCGAMQWSYRANVELIDALWSGVLFPRAADQTDLPVIAGLCVQPCFRNRERWGLFHHNSQSSRCAISSSPVFTNTEGNRFLSSRSSVVLFPV